MNLQSHKTSEYRGPSFRQKGVEFARFLNLLGQTRVPLEIAVDGLDARKVPGNVLSAIGLVAIRLATESRSQ